jgi:hypothetical protein
VSVDAFYPPHGPHLPGTHPLPPTPIAYTCTAWIFGWLACVGAGGGGGASPGMLMSSHVGLLPLSVGLHPERGEWRGEQQRPGRGVHPPDVRAGGPPAAPPRGITPVRTHGTVPLQGCSACPLLPDPTHSGTRSHPTSPPPPLPPQHRFWRSCSCTWWRECLVAAELGSVRAWHTRACTWVGAATACFKCTHAWRRGASDLHPYLPFPCTGFSIQCNGVPVFTFGGGAGGGVSTAGNGGFGGGAGKGSRCAVCCQRASRLRPPPLTPSSPPLPTPNRTALLLLPPLRWSSPRPECGGWGWMPVRGGLLCLLRLHSGRRRGQ